MLSFTTATMTARKPAKQLDADIAEALSTPRGNRTVRFSAPIVGSRGQIAPPRRGFVRLYRGGGGSLSDASSPTHGQWFTTMLSSARDYAGVVDDGRLPAGSSILVVDVHGADVARMPHTERMVAIGADDQEWLRDPNLLAEIGPPDVEVVVPVSVARAATRLSGRTRDVARGKPRI
jgi:hypothetical protein